MDPIEENHVMAEHQIFIEELTVNTNAIRARIKSYKRDYLSDSPNRNHGSHGQKIAQSKHKSGSDVAKLMKNKLRG
tara:strand:+ start:553 stop:780 length:228 start_codon:yes stop_codon:yes gene_type:complete